jgi:hypothetical protein
VGFPGFDPKIDKKSGFFSFLENRKTQKTWNLRFLEST